MSNNRNKRKRKRRKKRRNNLRWRVGDYLFREEDCVLVKINEVANYKDYARAYFYCTAVESGIKFTIYTKAFPVYDTKDDWKRVSEKEIGMRILSTLP